jgi:HTH-like domain
MVPALPGEDGDDRAVGDRADRVDATEPGIRGAGQGADEVVGERLLAHVVLGVQLDAFAGGDRGEKANCPVSLMCRVLGVNRTSLHDWERRAPSDHELYDAFLTDKIRQIHAASGGSYGSPRVHAELRLEYGHSGRQEARRAADARCGA